MGFVKGWSDEPAANPTAGTTPGAVFRVAVDCDDSSGDMSRSHGRDYDYVCEQEYDCVGTIGVIRVDRIIYL